MSAVQLGIRGAIALFVLAAATMPAPIFADDGGARSVFAGGVGNRALAMGGAYAAVADDASAAVWNPGGLGLLQRRELQATRASLYDLEMNEEYASLVIPSWRWGTAALTFRHFGVNGIEGRDSRNVLTNSALSDNETEITLSYGRGLRQGAWSLGGSLKLMRQSLGGVSAGGVGADVGMVVRPGLVLGRDGPFAHRFRIGIAVRNLIEPSLRLETESVTDPMTVRLGAAYRHDFNYGGGVVAAVDLEHSQDIDPKLHAGLEFRIHPMVALRSGVTSAGLTAGAGVRWNDVGFDYAFEDNDLGSLHRLGLSLQFGATTEQRRLASIRQEEERIQERLAEAFDKRQRERMQKLVAEAQAKHAAKEYQQALEVLAAINTIDPGRADVAALEISCWRERGRELEEAESFTDAALMYARALELDPEDTESASGLERCRSESDRRAERTQQLRETFDVALDAFGTGALLTARQGFRTVLDESPDDVDAQEMLRRTEEGISRRAQDLLAQADRYTRGDLFTEAREVLDEAEGYAQPDQIRASRGQVSRAERDKRDQERAERQRDREPTPVSTSTPTERQTPPAPARPTLSSAQKQEVGDLFRRGMKAYEEGRASEAMQYWELVHSKDKNHNQARQYLKREYLTRGMDDFAEGRLDEAVASWERALAVDPSDQRTQGYLARARQQLSRTREILGKGR